MLLETINYHSNLPFSISFSNVAQEDFHYHKEMEMLLVLRGTADCKIHNVSYTVGEGDILIVDTQDLHRITGSSDDILFLVFYIDLQFFEDLYPDIDYMIFACEDYGKNSKLKYQDLQKKVSVLKHHIAKTALAYFNEKDNTALLMECINDLVFTLVNQFQGFLIEDNKFKAGHGDSNDIDIKRLYKIIKYIYLNYDKKITLNDLSDIVHLNPYYISHLIKNTSGLSFQKFLNYVRLEYAEKKLIENKLTLTQISQFCGFSSLSYFNNCFKTWYNMTPAEYKKQRCPCERTYHQPICEETAISLLKPYVHSYGSVPDAENLPKSSRHIFIPVKYNYRSGKNFRKAFPLKFSISSDEDLFMLNYQKEKIKVLHNVSAVLDYQVIKKARNKHEILSAVNLLESLGIPVYVSYNGENPERSSEDIIKTLGIPMTSYTFLKRTDEKNEIKTVSSALRSIMYSSDTDICLSGQTNALFTPEGLITPYYSVYSILSQIDGNITEQRDHYMIVKNKDTIYLLVFQDNKKTLLKAHIHIKDFSGQGLIIEKSYTREHSCYVTLQALRNPAIVTDAIKEHINTISSGTVKLSMTKAENSLDINFDIEPDTLIFAEITKQ